MEQNHAIEAAFQASEAYRFDMADAVRALESGQQCDADGVMIQVSRQALELVLGYVKARL